jgi:O-antigen ligase
LLLAACSTVALAVIQVVAGPRAFAVGIHKNNMGMGLAAGLSIWLCAWFDPTRAWWSKYVVAAVGIVTVGLVFTLSRGAWVGASCALVSLAIMYGRLQLLFRTGLVIVPLVAIMWNYLPKEDRQYAASFERKHLNNIDTRYNNFDRSYALIEKSPLIGNGVSIRKQLDATNLVMATLAEGGVVGFVLFLIPFGVYFALVSRLVRVLPRSDPKFFIVAASCALMVSRLGHAQFDHYWVRGASTIAWASVGMVLAVGQTTSLTRRHSAMVLVDSKKRERLFN